MLPTLPNHSRFPTPQLLYSQDFASNSFRFIDLARTLAVRLNRFIDLREFACFFSGVVPCTSLYLHIRTFVAAPTSKSTDSVAALHPCAASFFVISTPWSSKACNSA